MQGEETVPSNKAIFLWKIKAHKDINILHFHTGESFSQIIFRKIYWF